MPRHSASASIAALSDCTEASVHASFLNNESLSPNLSIEESTVLQDDSNASIRHFVGEMSFIERVRASATDLEAFFPRGSLNDRKLLIKRKKKTTNTSLNSTNNNSNDESSVLSENSSLSVNVSNPDDSFFKKPKGPVPKGKSPRSKSKKSKEVLEKSPVSASSSGVSDQKRSTRSRSKKPDASNAPMLARKVSVDLPSDSSSGSIDDETPSESHDQNNKGKLAGPSRAKSKRKRDIDEDNGSLDSPSSKLEIKNTPKNLPRRMSPRKISVDLQSDSSLESIDAGGTPDQDHGTKEILARRRVSVKLTDFELNDSDSQAENSISDGIAARPSLPPDIAKLASRRISVRFSELNDSDSQNENSASIEGEQPSLHQDKNVSVTLAEDSLNNSEKSLENSDPPVNKNEPDKQAASNLEDVEPMDVDEDIPDEPKSLNDITNLPIPTGENTKKVDHGSGGNDENAKSDVNVAKEQLVKKRLSVRFALDDTAEKNESADVTGISDISGYINAMSVEISSTEVGNASELEAGCSFLSDSLLSIESKNSRKSLSRKAKESVSTTDQSVNDSLLHAMNAYMKNIKKADSTTSSQSSEGTPNSQKESFPSKDVSINNSNLSENLESPGDTPNRDSDSERNSTKESLQVKNKESVTGEENSVSNKSEILSKDGNTSGYTGDEASKDVSVDLETDISKMSETLRDAAPETQNTDNSNVSNFDISLLSNEASLVAGLSKEKGKKEETLREDSFNISDISGIKSDISTRSLIKRNKNAHVSLDSQAVEKVIPRRVSVAFELNSSCESTDLPETNERSASIKDISMDSTLVGAQDNEGSVSKNDLSSNDTTMEETVNDRPLMEDTKHSESNFKENLKKKRISVHFDLDESEAVHSTSDESKIASQDEKDADDACSSNNPESECNEVNQSCLSTDSPKTAVDVNESKQLDISKVDNSPALGMDEQSDDDQPYEMELTNVNKSVEMDLTRISRASCARALKDASEEDEQSAEQPCDDTANKKCNELKQADTTSKPVENVNSEDPKNSPNSRAEDTPENTDSENTETKTSTGFILGNTESNDTVTTTKPRKSILRRSTRKSVCQVTFAEDTKLVDKDSRNMLEPRSLRKKRTSVMNSTIVEPSEEEKLDEETHVTNSKEADSTSISPSSVAQNTLSGNNELLDKIPHKNVSVNVELSSNINSNVVDLPSENKTFTDNLDETSININELQLSKKKVSVCFELDSTVNENIEGSSLKENGESNSSVSPVCDTMKSVTPKEIAMECDEPDKSEQKAINCDSSVSVNKSIRSETVNPSAKTTVNDGEDTSVNFSESEFDQSVHSNKSFKKVCPKRVSVAFDISENDSLSVSKGDAANQSLDDGTGSSSSSDKVSPKSKVSVSLVNDGSDNLASSEENAFENDISKKDGIERITLKSSKVQSDDENLKITSDTSQSKNINSHEPSNESQSQDSSETDKMSSSDDFKLALDESESDLSVRVTTPNASTKKSQKNKNPKVVETEVVDANQLVETKLPCENNASPVRNKNVDSTTNVTRKSGLEKSSDLDVDTSVNTHNSTNHDKALNQSPNNQSNETEKVLSDSNKTGFTDTIPTVTDNTFSTAKTLENLVQKNVSVDFEFTNCTGETTTFGGKTLNTLLKSSCNTEQTLTNVTGIKKDLAKKRVSVKFDLSDADSEKDSSLDVQRGPLSNQSNVEDLEKTKGNLPDGKCENSMALETLKSAYESVEMSVENISVFRKNVDQSAENLLDTHHRNRRSLSVEKDDPLRESDEIMGDIQFSDIARKSLDNNILPLDPPPSTLGTLSDTYTINNCTANDHSSISELSAHIDSKIKKLPSDQTFTVDLGEVSNKEKDVSSVEHKKDVGSKPTDGSPSQNNAEIIPAQNEVQTHQNKVTKATGSSQSQNSAASPFKNKDTEVLPAQNKVDAVLSSQDLHTGVLPSHNKDNGDLPSLDKDAEVFPSQNENTEVLLSQNENTELLPAQNKDAQVLPQTVGENCVNSTAEKDSEYYEKVHVSQKISILDDLPKPTPSNFDLEDSDNFFPPDALPLRYSEGNARNVLNVENISLPNVSSNSVECYPEMARKSVSDISEIEQNLSVKSNDGKLDTSSKASSLLESEELSLKSDLGTPPTELPVVDEKQTEKDEPQQSSSDVVEAIQDPEKSINAETTLKRTTRRTPRSTKSSSNSLREKSSSPVDDHDSPNDVADAESNQTVKKLRKNKFLNSSRGKSHIADSTASDTKTDETNQSGKRTLRSKRSTLVPYTLTESQDSNINQSSARLLRSKKSVLNSSEEHGGLSAVDEKASLQSRPSSEAIPNRTKKKSSKSSTSKTVTFGSNFYKSPSSDEHSSEPPSLQDPSASKGKNETDVFVQPQVPPRRSKDASEPGFKRSRSRLEEQYSPCEESNNESKRKRNDDKTIDELSYDAFDVSSIPRDKTAFQKILVYHSTPIHPVLERREKKSRSNETKNASSSVRHTDKTDKMIQVSKGIGTSGTVDTSVSTRQKKDSQELSTSYSVEWVNKGNSKRKKSSQNETDSKRKKTLQESPQRSRHSNDESLFSPPSPDSPESTNEPNSTSYTNGNTTSPHWRVRFRQNVQFRNAPDSDFSKGFASATISEISDRSYHSANMSSTFRSTFNDKNRQDSTGSNRLTERESFKKPVPVTERVSVSMPSTSKSPHNNTNSFRRSSRRQTSFSKNDSKLSESFRSQACPRNEDVNAETSTATLFGRDITDTASLTLTSDCTALGSRLGVLAPHIPNKKKNTTKKPPQQSIISAVSHMSKYSKQNHSDPHFGTNGKSTSKSMKFPAKWVDIELYKYLVGVLKHSHHINAPSIAENLISCLCATVAGVKKLSSQDDVSKFTLHFRRLIVNHNVCSNKIEYFTFLMKYTPNDFQRKVLPIDDYFGSVYQSNKDEKMSDPIIDKEELNVAGLESNNNVSEINDESESNFYESESEPEPNNHEEESNSDVSEFESNAHDQESNIHEQESNDEGSDMEVTRNSSESDDDS